MHYNVVLKDHNNVESGPHPVDARDLKELYTALNLLKWHMDFRANAGFDYYVVYLAGRPAYSNYSKVAGLAVPDIFELF